MGEKSSWFSTGTGDVKKAREQMASQYKPEFWLKDGESAKVIVLDKEPFNIMVHQVELRGKFKKYTCMKKGCPLCKVNEPRFLSVYRIIDTRSYEDKNKKVHKNVERYWEIGTKAMAQVESLEEDENFFGKIIKVKRVGAGPKTSYAITYVGDPDKRPKATLKPTVDYMPKSLAELQTLAELLGADKDDDDDDQGSSGSSGASRYYDQDDDDDDDKAAKKSGKKTGKKPKDEDEDEEATESEDPEDEDQDNEEED